MSPVGEDRERALPKIFDKALTHHTLPSAEAASAALRAKAPPFGEVFEDSEGDYNTHRKHPVPAYQIPVPFEAHLHSLD